MTPLFDLPAVPVNDATGDDLREQVHRHLMRHPMLTAFEVARALRLPPARVDSVRRQLLAMEGDGEAERHEVPRSAGDRRPAIRWEAT